MYIYSIYYTYISYTSVYTGVHTYAYHNLNSQENIEIIF